MFTRSDLLKWKNSYLSRGKDSSSTRMTDFCTPFFQKKRIFRYCSLMNAQSTMIDALEKMTNYNSIILASIYIGRIRNCVLLYLSKTSINLHSSPLGL